MSPQQISQSIAMAHAAVVNSVACNYCSKPLTAEELAAHLEVGETDRMCNACAMDSEPEIPNEQNLRTALEAELARLNTENAALTAAQKPAATPVKRDNSAMIPAPKSLFAGTYPPNATVQDKIILDLIHATKAPKVDPKYTVPPCFGAALYDAFHQALRAKYPPSPETNPDKIAKGKKWNWVVCDSQIKPHMDSAVSRGIITKVFGDNTVMYFDAREKAPRLQHADTISKAIVSAVAGAF